MKDLKEEKEIIIEQGNFLFYTRITPYMFYKKIYEKASMISLHFLSVLPKNLKNINKIKT